MLESGSWGHSVLQTPALVCGESLLMSTHNICFFCGEFLFGALHIFFYFFMKTYVVGTLQGASNLSPQHMLLWRNKKNIYVGTPYI